MCSIVGVFGTDSSDDVSGLRSQALERSRRLRHRGPDWSGVYVDTGAVLVHERLAIVDPAGGAQPLCSADGGLALAVNGEIYNHEILKSQLRHPYAFTTASDCEVINALYGEESLPRFLSRMNGIFAFALWDSARRRFVIARDPIGVCPLYWGHDAQGHVWVASEMKALHDICPDVAQFPPGHYYSSDEGGLKRYYERPWTDYGFTRGVKVSSVQLREAFEQAVHRQMMSDVPYGVLLSGGLDSSLVAACAAASSGAHASNPQAGGWWPRLHSFSIGLNGSPDLAAAEIAASAIGTVHHGFRFTFDEGLDALPEVIRHIESYDVTSVRASVPMYLLARRIRAMGLKMVLSGEGADEIFGGYLYFHKAPSAEAFHEETVRKVLALYQYDCLRANKAMMAWGVEARVPFLDLEFLDLAMGLDAEAKRAGQGRMEKTLLRQAFQGYLPEAILWRQKEQFSDGVGYGWIDGLKAHAGREVAPLELARAAERYPINPPATPEAYLYRSIFDQHFPEEACARTVPGGKSIACSSAAAILWDRSFATAADPSGRSVADVHCASRVIVRSVSLNE